MRICSPSSWLECTYLWGRKFLLSWLHWEKCKATEDSPAWVCNWPETKQKKWGTDGCATPSMRTCPTVPDFSVRTCLSTRSSSHDYTARNKKATEDTLIWVHNRLTWYHSRTSETLLNGQYNVWGPVPLVTDSSLRTCLSRSYFSRDCTIWKARWLKICQR